MPLVDMPLADLHYYQGRNPKPLDFDEFWDKGLAEMRSIDPQIELTPHPINAKFAECFHLRFTGVGGARIYAKLMRPKHLVERTPAVVKFHGYSAHGGEWNDKLQYVANGFTVASLDCRGQGGLSEDSGAVKGTTLRGHIIRGLDDAPENMLFRQIFLDCAQLAKIVMDMPEVDETRVAASGGSQGGGLTLACAALEPRIARAAPTYPFLCDYQRVWEMDLAVNAYDELKSYFRTYDPQHKREQEIFTKLGYIDVQHLAPRIRGEVMLGCGLSDSICPPSTQFAAYNKISSKKSVELYPDFGHESLPWFGDKTFDWFSEM